MNAAERRTVLAGLAGAVSVLGLLLLLAPGAAASIPGASAPPAAAGGPVLAALLRDAPALVPLAALALLLAATAVSGRGRPAAGTALRARALGGTALLIGVAGGALGMRAAALAVREAPASEVLAASAPGTRAALASLSGGVLVCLLGLVAGALAREREGSGGGEGRAAGLFPSLAAFPVLAGAVASHALAFGLLSGTGLSFERAWVPWELGRAAEWLALGAGVSAAMVSISLVRPDRPPPDRGPVRVFAGLLLASAVLGGLWVSGLFVLAGRSVPLLGDVPPSPWRAGLRAAGPMPWMVLLAGAALFAPLVKTARHVADGSGLAAGRRDARTLGRLALVLGLLGAGLALLWVAERPVVPATPGAAPPLGAVRLNLVHVLGLSVFAVSAVIAVAARPLGREAPEEPAGPVATAALLALVGSVVCGSGALLAGWWTGEVAGGLRVAGGGLTGGAAVHLAGPPLSRLWLRSATRGRPRRRPYG